MKNEKPKVVELVEKQTHKSYGERINGKAHISLPPIFENTARCWACGKVEHVNAFGFCEKCWVAFAHLRNHED